MEHHTDIRDQEAAMKEIKIDIPEGYEIDKDESTFERIVFKPVIKNLLNWEKLPKLEGYYINKDSKIIGSITLCKPTANSNQSVHKNIFATKEQAESALAMAQLSQLMAVNPECSSESRYVIMKDRKRRHVAKIINEEFRINYFLRFDSNEAAVEFLNANLTLIDCYFKGFER